MVGTVLSDFAYIILFSPHISSVSYCLELCKLLQLSPALWTVDPMDCSPPTQLLCPWDTPGKNTGLGFPLGIIIIPIFQRKRLQWPSFSTRFT